MADENEVKVYEPIDIETVKAQIFEVRGYRVMLDSDIALYFDVATGQMNRAMKRNIKRFPEEFCFQLTDEEVLRCQFGISKKFAQMVIARQIYYSNKPDDNTDLTLKQKHNRSRLSPRPDFP